MSQCQFAIHQVSVRVVHVLHISACIHLFMTVLMYAAPTFASAAPSDTLPDTARLATLQDATNPHLNLGLVLAANAVALLVDGWITGSNGKFASG